MPCRCSPIPVTARRGESRARGPARVRSDGRRAGAATAGGGYFPPPERRAVQLSDLAVRRSGFASRGKIAAARRPLLRSGRERCSPDPPAVW
jgi:hypothetical protein